MVAGITTPTGIYRMSTGTVGTSFCRVAAVGRFRTYRAGTIGQIAGAYTSSVGAGLSGRTLGRTVPVVIGCSVFGTRRRPNVFTLA